jgi:probable HAF family extracellular repeat protein
MIDLGKLGGVYSDAQGINDPGQIVGLTNMPSAGDRAYVWTPTTPNGTTGVMVSIGVLGTGWSSQGNGINNAGQVVGWSYWTNDPTDGHDNEQHAFLWTPAVPNGSTGAMVDLGTLGDRRARPWRSAPTGRSPAGPTRRRRDSRVSLDTGRHGWSAEQPANAGSRHTARRTPESRLRCEQLRTGIRLVVRRR